MEIGSELRSARTSRALSLDDIARDTKIAPSVLRAIESNAFHDIPGGLFTRGYLRAYARSVRLDPEAIVERYRTEYEPAAPIAPPGAGQEPVVAIHHDVVFHDAAIDRSSRHSEIIQFAIVIVIAFVYLASLRPAKPVPDAELQAAESAVVVLPAVAPAARHRDPPDRTLLGRRDRRR
jgi:cytoskeletal protein RodZ